MGLPNSGLLNEISQEFISVKADTRIGVELISEIETLRSQNERRRVTHKSFPTLDKIIKKYTGINIKMKSLGDVLDVGIYIESFSNQSSINIEDDLLESYGARSVFDNNVFNDSGLLEAEVDLEKARVTGWYTEPEFELFIGVPIILGTLKDITPGEAAAIILHEVGHAFFSLATIGEYVWTNYYLSDGVDVVLGKKPNKFKVKILESQNLASEVSDRKLKKKIESGECDEKDVRKAILDVIPDNRHMLGSKLATEKRHEQMADVYPARVGLGEELITGLNKMTNDVYGFRMRQEVYTLVEIAFFIVSAKATVSALGTSALVFLAKFIPQLAVIFLLFYIVALSMVYSKFLSDGTSEYDTIKERFVKVRRELVNQLKNHEVSSEYKAKVDQQIKRIDELLKTIYENRSIFQIAGHLVLPAVRRNRRRLKNEQLLESLMNNDLFVTSYRLKQI